MRLALAFVAGILCSALVLLVAAQAPSELGRYQIAAGPENSGGTVFQLDTYTGRLYVRDWYWGKVQDAGTLDKPLAMPGATRPKSSQ